MFIVFSRYRRPMLLVASSALLIALSAVSAGSAAALRGTSGHRSTAKRDPARSRALLVWPLISYTTIDFPGASSTQIRGVTRTIDFPGASSTQLGGITGTAIDFPGAASTKVRVTRTALLRQVAKVVGVYDDAHGEHGFVMSLGHYTTLDFPGANFTIADGINHRGQIVGTYGIGAPALRLCGFIYDAGSYTTIPGSCAGPGPGLDPSGINNAGDIVGDIVGGTRNTAGFLTVNGIVDSGITFPGAIRTSLRGLNNNAVPEVVGTYLDAHQIEHGIAFTGSNASAARLIDKPGADGTEANGVNDSGQVVGSYDTNGVHGFVDNGGRFATIDYPGVSYTVPSGIDDPSSLDHSYDVVGTYSGDHGFHGFIATVTPVLAASAPITVSARKK